MRLKQLVCLLLALLLAAALAVSAFAEPDEAETATDPFAETLDSGQTAAPGFSVEPRIPGEDEATEEAPQPILYATEAQTTIGIVPYNDVLLEDGAREGLLSRRSMSAAALALSGVALLLSVLALLRTRKKSAPNATGNYQKYF